jgi:hypothetical protein
MFKLAKSRSAIYHQSKGLPSTSRNMSSRYSSKMATNKLTPSAPTTSDIKKSSIQSRKTVPVTSKPKRINHLSSSDESKLLNNETSKKKSTISCSTGVYKKETVKKSSYHSVTNKTPSITATAAAINSKRTLQRPKKNEPVYISKRRINADEISNNNDESLEVSAHKLSTPAEQITKPPILLRTKKPVRGAHETSSIYLHNKKPIQKHSSSLFHNGSIEIKAKSKVTATNTANNYKKIIQKRNKVSTYSSSMMVLDNGVDNCFLDNNTSEAKEDTSFQPDQTDDGKAERKISFNLSATAAESKSEIVKIKKGKTYKSLQSQFSNAIIENNDQRHNNSTNQMKIFSDQEGDTESEIDASFRNNKGCSFMSIMSDTTRNNETISFLNQSASLLNSISKSRNVSSSSTTNNNNDPYDLMDSINDNDNSNNI